MEQERRLINKIAYTHPSNFSSLPPFQRSVIPLLSLTSSLYKLALLSRHHLYNLGFFKYHRLPLPVNSVGNLTWGGNGKTPMVEFLAILFDQIGITPLVLTRITLDGNNMQDIKKAESRTYLRYETARWMSDQIGHSLISTFRTEDELMDLPENLDMSDAKSVVLNLLMDEIVGNRKMLHAGTETGLALTCVAPKTGILES